MQQFAYLECTMCQIKSLTNACTTVRLCDCQSMSSVQLSAPQVNPTSVHFVLYVHYCFCISFSHLMVRNVRQFLHSSFFFYITKPFLFQTTSTINHEVLSVDRYCRLLCHLLCSGWLWQLWGLRWLYGCTLLSTKQWNQQQHV